MTISFVSHTETGVSAATTTVTHPTGITADDWLVLVANSKASSRVPTAPADWTNRGNISGGSGAAGVDTGITRLTYWSQLADGAETGTFDITWSASSTNQVAEMVFRKTVTGAWVNAFVFGDDATQSSGSGSISVTPATDPGFTTGDMVVFTFGLTTDAGVLLNPAITVPGCTVGLITERVNFRSTAGNDGGIWVVTAPIATGTSTGPPTFTADTLELNASAGPGLFVRLREPAGTGGSGSATLASTSAVTATGRKNSSETASISSVAQTLSTGFKSVSATVTIGVASAASASGFAAPTFSGTATIAAVSTTTATGQKSVSSIASITALSTAAATGESPASLANRPVLDAVAFALEGIISFR